MQVTQLLWIYSALNKFYRYPLPEARAQRIPATDIPIPSLKFVARGLLLVSLSGNLFGMLQALWKRIWPDVTTSEDLLRITQDHSLRVSLKDSLRIIPPFRKHSTLIPEKPPRILSETCHGNHPTATAVTPRGPLRTFLGLLKVLSEPLQTPYPLPSRKRCECPRNLLWVLFRNLLQIVKKILGAIKRVCRLNNDLRIT